MPNIGVPELLIILLVALVVFGPRKLPDLGRSLGQGLREFRRHTSGVTEEFKAGLQDIQPAPLSSAPVTAPVTAPLTAPPQDERQAS